MPISATSVQRHSTDNATAKRAMTEVRSRPAPVTSVAQTWLIAETSPCTRSIR